MESSIVIIRGNAGELPLAAESVDCIVTSPLYNAGMDYDGVSDEQPWAQYVIDAYEAAHEMERVLKPGGRAWVNVMPTVPSELTGGTYRNGPGKKGGHLVARVPLQSIWLGALQKAHLSYRDTVAWIQDSYDGACSWGSKWSPNAPNLRGSHEGILLFHKGPWMRGRVEQNDIPREKWAEWTRNVWFINPEQQRKGHPAPFPAELPRRCILLSTWPGDVVVDPFVGSGTTVRVAKDLGRIGIGIDLSQQYCRSALAREAQEVLL